MMDPYNLMARQYYRNPYSTRRPPERSPTPSLAGVWLLIGIFMGVGIMGLAYIFYSPVIPQQLRLGAEQQNTANATNPPNAAISAAIDQNRPKQSVTQTQSNAPVHKTRTARTQPAPASQNEAGQRFEFYTLLPGMEVALPDQKIAHKPSPNSNSNSQARPRAKPEQKTVVPVSASASVTSPVAVPASAPASVATPTRASATNPGSTLTLKPNGHPNGLQQSAQRYIVQAGLFQKINEADALKARLTLQGFQPRLQKIQTQQGNTWFRVTLGPFLSESQALQQKKRLEDQKINGILILQRPNMSTPKT